MKIVKIGIRDVAVRRFQIYFKSEKTSKRFRAACALVDRNMNDVLEEFAKEFADKKGVPDERKT